MDISIPSQERELMQEEQQRGEALVEIAIPCIPPGPSVLPQASTPVSQSAPAFFPASLPIPSQPEFSHVRVHVNIYPDFFFLWGYCRKCIFEPTSVLLCGASLLNWLSWASLFLPVTVICWWYFSICVAVYPAEKIQNSLRGHRELLNVDFFVFYSTLKTLLVLFFFFLSLKGFYFLMLNQAFCISNCVRN